MNPYTPQRPPARPDTRPLYKRKRVWAAGVALFAMGAIGGTQSAHDDLAAARTLNAKPGPTVTVTATATATRTAAPAPAATVTRTRTVSTPGPTVTVTEAAAQAAGSGAGAGTASGDTGGGTCSIVSSAGNCYRAGQFCRDSDHGAETTTAGGAPITCSHSANAWRWTYS